MNRTLETYRDLDALSRAAAGTIAGALRSRESLTIALSGGATPARLFELLGTEWRDRTPWHRVHLFWADERFVPADHAENNYRAAADSFIDRIPIPDENVHPIPTDRIDVDAAADAYEDVLRSVFHGDASTAFDVAVLGLGADGHTASLFPGWEPPADRWAAALRAPERITPRERITLTPDLLNRSRSILFLVSGRRKRDALRRVFDDDPALPATHILGREETLFLADAEAWGAESP